MMRLRTINHAFRAEPEAIVLSAVCVISGFFALASVRPTAIKFELTEFAQMLWSSALLIGGIARVIGLFARRPRWDGFGCLILGWAALTFGLAITRFNFQGIVGALLVAGFGYACLVRWWQYYQLGKNQSRPARDG